MEKSNENNLRASFLDANDKNLIEDKEKFLIKYESAHKVNIDKQINEIRTSKYNYYNFLFKILFEQFSQVANIYFLILGILQLFPSISPSGKSNTIVLLPLIFVVSVNGIKDFVEDFKRKLSDDRENNSKCLIIKDNKKEKTKNSNSKGEEKFLKEALWKNIKPGDIVKIRKDENFPADMVLLYSSNKNGSAFTETKNLDGETNLKYRESIKSIFSYLKNCNSEIEVQYVLKKLNGYIECEDPNPHLYEFKGIMQLRNSDILDESLVQGSSNNNSANVKRISICDEYGYDQEVAVLVRNLIKESNQLIKKESKQIHHNEGDEIIRVDSFHEKNNRSKQNSIFFSSQRSIPAELKSEISQRNERNNKSSLKTNLISIDNNNIFLRGSSLKNTEYVYGIIIYTGHQSKIMMNSLNARTKVSKVFKQMNRYLMAIILVQIFISLILTIFNFISNTFFINNEFLVIKGFNTTIDEFFYYIKTFFSWVITLTNIVPISLLVTIEMIKFCQAYFISWDYKIYDKNNKRTAIVQSSGLNEELGQVKHIFTDKTGTLTKNQMVFRYIFIDETLYGNRSDESGQEFMLNEMQKCIPNVNFKDELFFKHLNDSDSKNHEKIKRMIFAMSVCHSVIPEKNEETGKTFYNSSSPDEAALVNGARFLGSEFADRTDDSFIVINNQNKISKSKLLYLFEFDSDRKRMSVVIKDENNKAKLITKGADMVIFKRVKQNENNIKIQKNCQKQLEEFGKEGLRTLVFAQRDINEDDLKKIEHLYLKALSNLKEKNQRLHDLYEEFEKDLDIIGCTAVEDCLQDDLSKIFNYF